MIKYSLVFWDEQPAQTVCPAAANPAGRSILPDLLNFHLYHHLKIPFIGSV